MNTETNGATEKSNSGEGDKIVRKYLICIILGLFVFFSTIYALKYV